jgi:hypothetical protein
VIHHASETSYVDNLAELVPPVGVAGSIAQSSVYTYGRAGHTLLSYDERRKLRKILSISSPSSYRSTHFPRHF